MSSTPPETPPAETPDLRGAYPRLSEAQVGTLAEHGERRETRAGDVLFREGEVGAELVVILAGKVATVEGFGHQQRLVGVHGPRRFLGELNLLVGGPSFATAVVRDGGAVVLVPVARLHAIVARDHALGDVILRAYLQRRTLLLGLAGGLRILGSRFSARTGRVRELVERSGRPSRWIDLEEDAAVESLLRALAVAPEQTPVVVWHGEWLLRNPGDAELARAVGLPAPPAEADCDVVVVGAGPAGLAAAVHAASEGMRIALLDAVAAGGQAADAPRVADEVGFPDGVSGGELAGRAATQAQRLGADLRVPAAAVALEQHDGLHVVGLDGGGRVAARTVIVATGARQRRLEADGLGRFEGTSVRYTAGVEEARACGGEAVAVAGGGDEAGAAALVLAAHAATVQLLVPGDPAASMSRYLAAELARHPRVQVAPHCVVRELVGDGALRGVVAEDGAGRRTVDARMLFVILGAQAQTAWLGGAVGLDGDGFVLTGPAASRALLLETTRGGVFAAGAVRHEAERRVAAAMAEGAMAARMAQDHLGRADGDQARMGLGLSLP